MFLVYPSQVQELALLLDSSKETIRLTRYGLGGSGVSWYAGL